MEWEYDERTPAPGSRYSRAVAGDLCPGPVSPLTATAGIVSELAPSWRDAYLESGVWRPQTGAAVPPVGGGPIAMFGGYLYLNTSLARTFATRVCGADPVGFARRYVGDVAEAETGPAKGLQGPADGAISALVGQVDPGQVQGWMHLVLRFDQDLTPFRELDDRVRRLRKGRPDFTAIPDRELASRIGAVRGELRRAVGLFVRSELATAVSAELLSRAGSEAGHPGLATALIAGTGGALTSEPLPALWEHSRQVARSAKLSTLFDRGIPTVASQLSTTRNTELAELRAALAPLLSEWDFRGPGEWELSTPTWGTDIRLVLGILDVLRRLDSDQCAMDRPGPMAEEAARHVELVRRSLADFPRAVEHLDTTLAAAAGWLRARRRAWDATAALHHEQRLAARELGHRQVREGLLDDVEQIFMLLFGELDEFVAAPARFAETLRMRSYDHHALARYRPPSHTVGRPPPVVRWPRGAAGVGAGGRKKVTGTTAGAGIARGRLRPLRSPAEPTTLHPGEVLVIPTGSSCWEPLLPAAAAVVVEDGSPLSAVAVACRDLGIPCLVGAAEATSRLPAEALAQVDASTGGVALLPRGSAAAVAPG